MKWFVLLFFCHAASAETHSLKVFFTGSSGFTDLPEFEAVVEVDSILAGYCNKNTFKATTEWMRRLLETHELQQAAFTRYCSVDMPAFFKHMLVDLKQLFNQTEGAHVFQRIAVCELDEDTKKFRGSLKYGYDGDDFIGFDLDTQTWISLTPQAEFIRQSWDANSDDKKFHVNKFNELCPLWLNLTLRFGNGAEPTVSLLQRTPSSPVRCHATGFYPTSALLFWRKDGQEVHQNVDRGQILPNDDETFQLHVDLDVSSLVYEDWPRNDCVFQLTGVEDEIIKLDKAVIQTNRKTLSQRRIVVAVMSVLSVLIVAALGFIAYKKIKERYPVPGPEMIPL